MKKKLLDIFIISWTGYHEKSQKIALALENLPVHVTIIWSDIDENVSKDWICKNIQVPNDWYFGKKFNTCLEHLSDTEYMMVIQADVDCKDWAKLVLSAINVYETHTLVGAWAPLIDYTWFSLDITEIGQLQEELYIVAQTDSIIFSFKKEILPRLKQFDYKSNKYGWGIDWVVMAIVYSNQQVAVVDTRIKVHHPKGSGYDTKVAMKQMNDFLENLSNIELIQYHLLSSLITLSRINNEKQINNLNI